MLSRNGHLTPAMRALAIELVPIWSPELQFLFDPAVPVAELRTHLRERDIAIYKPVLWEEYVSGDRARLLAEAFSPWRPLSATKPPLKPPLPVED